MRGEVAPDITLNRVRRERAAGVRVQQRNGYAKLRRKIIVFQKIVRHHNRGHLRLEIVGFGLVPVLLPAARIIGASASLRFVEPRHAGWQLARMTSGAVFSENLLAPLELPRVLRQILVSPGASAR